jgi:hypothetical protein
MVSGNNIFNPSWYFSTVPKGMLTCTALASLAAFSAAAIEDADWTRVLEQRNDGETE